MKRTIQNDSYRLLNLIFTGIILLIFAYSIFYGEEKPHPVPSFYDSLTGKNSISTGLSRSFSAIVRLNFADARAFNPYGIRIFIFFLIQLLMRVAGYVFGTGSRQAIIMKTDIIVSGLLFIFFFWPFIRNLFLQL